MGRQHPSVSVVIVARNEQEHLRATVESFRDSGPEGLEIVVVDDRSDDGGARFLREPSFTAIRSHRPRRQLGIARARNLGARLSSGRIIVFSDAHVSVAPGWLEPLVDALRRKAVGVVAPAVVSMTDRTCRGYGQIWRYRLLEVEWLPRRTREPHPVPLIGGGFLAMRRRVFETVGGFDRGMLNWGYEDAELSLRLWLLGYECLVQPRVRVEHLFRARHPYAVDWVTTGHNLLRLAFLHFDDTRVARVLEATEASSWLASSLRLLMAGDVARQSTRLRAARVHDDDWFFQRWGEPWEKAVA